MQRFYLYYCDYWVYDEINGILRSPNILTVHTPLLGPDVICGANVVYSIPDCSGAVQRWVVSDNLQVIEQTESFIRLKVKASNTQTSAFLRAVFKYRSASKSIAIGKPTLAAVLDPNVTATQAKAIITGLNSTIESQDITQVHIEVVSGSGYARVQLRSYPTHYEVWGFGQTNNWYKWVKLIATNSCGTSETTFRLTPPASEPCDQIYVFKSTERNQYALSVPPDPCGNYASGTSSAGYSAVAPPTENEPSLENKKVTISVYNIYGFRVLRTHKKEINLTPFKNGLYFLKAKIDGKTYSKKVVKN